MIVPMKKVAVITQAKDATATVETMRSLGVLHVEHQQVPQGKDVSALRDDMAMIDTALSILSEEELCDLAARPNHAHVLNDWPLLAKHIIDSRKRLDQLQEYSRVLKNRISEWEPWGDFDPQAVGHLEQKNIHIRLYRIPTKEVRNIPGGLIVKTISIVGSVAYCAVISREKADLPFPQVALPKMSLLEMRSRFAEDLRTIEHIKKDVRRHSGCCAEFMRIKKLLQSDLEFFEAFRGMGQAGEFVYLVGYVPVDSVTALLETAKKEKWGIRMTEPSGDDQVPTLIRNPRWVSLISPLFKLLEISPGYTELDISPLFLAFFSIFFGMIIGDAGYGSLYLLLTFVAHRRLGGKIQDQRIFPLLYLLSSCAIVWGVLTGTFFGQAWLAASGVKALAPVLNDPVFIQGLCFFIGVTHLSLAHFWRFTVQWPSSTALAELGWVSILWAAFLLVKVLLLGALFPAYGKYLIIGGISLVVFFANPRKNIFARLGAGLGTIALSLMNSFGDIVSYVRLFAVGLAGVAISDAFNSMAGGSATSGVFGFIAAGFILVAGHLLNFVLSPMSVLVHGVRLNVLEFSGHAGVTWSGTPYKPLKK